jgi:hypothetical protein
VLIVPLVDVYVAMFTIYSIYEQVLPTAKVVHALNEDISSDLALP